MKTWLGITEQQVTDLLSFRGASSFMVNTALNEACMRLYYYDIIGDIKFILEWKSGMTYDLRIFDDESV